MATAVFKKGQLVISDDVKEELSLAEGDAFDVATEGNAIVLRPRPASERNAVVDREVAAALEEEAAGAIHGPFETAEEMAAYIKANPSG